MSDVDAAAWTSPDGLTWSRVQHREATLGGTGHQRMEAVAAGDDLFVAVGHDEEVDAAGSPTNLDAAVWTSPEGLEWTRVPHDETVFGGPPITSEFEPGRVGDPSSQAMVDVTTGGPGFVAVGLAEDAATGDTAAVWTSADGLSWARVTDQADLDHTTGSGLLWMRGVTEADGRLVAVGWETSSERQFSAAVWTSEDGLAWTRLPHDGAAFGSGSQWFGMDDVVAGGPGFVAVGTEMPGDAPRELLPALDAEDVLTTPRPMAVGVFGPAIWTSEDGLTWSRIPADQLPASTSDDVQLRAVTAADSGLIAVGLRGSGDDVRAEVWTSPDGLRWTVATDPQQALAGPQRQVMADVAAGGGGLVGVGAAGTPFLFTTAVWTSP